MSSTQEWDRVAYVAPADPVPADGSMVSPASVFRAHVESYKDDDFFEEGGTFHGAEAAIRWACQRAPIVMIRLGGRGDTYFSAGQTLAAGEDGVPLPAWPPEQPPGGWWAPP